MLKKAVFVLACVMLVFGATGSVALAGNGVPAIVGTRKDGVTCGAVWIEWRQDRSVWVPVMIEGVATFVYQPDTGWWTSSCQYFVDFDNPMTATIDEACEISEEILPDQIDCKNNAFVWEGWDCWAGDMYTTDSVTIVNSNGVGVGTCTYNP